MGGGERERGRERERARELARERRTEREGEKSEIEGEIGRGGGRGGGRKEERRGEASSWLTVNAVSFGQLKLSVFNFFKYDNTLIYCLVDFWFKVALKALSFLPNKNT